MRKSFFPLMLLLIISALVTGCNRDEPPGFDHFVVAFENPSQNFGEDSTHIKIPLVFSRKAPRDGSLTVSISSHYGDENGVRTLPPSRDGIMTVPIAKGAGNTAFTLEKDSDSSQNGSIKFAIVGISMGGINTLVRGNTTTQISFVKTASAGGAIAPDVGGPNEPNQVYVDLSAPSQTKVRRDTWDLGFYSGDGFQVKLNGALYMFAGALPTTDIDGVGPTDVVALKAKMDFLVEGSNDYVDDPSGAIEGTAIKTISATDGENPVYLLKLGYEIGTDIPGIGGVSIAGESRGYKKIRILRQGNAYVLQYADLNASSHHQITIPKSPDYNFGFFSFDSEAVVQVEPKKHDWDLNFTVSTEVEELPSGGLTAYGYSDYALTNSLGGVRAYRVSTSDFSYAEFSKDQVVETDFNADQQTIGSSWRKVTPPDRMLYNAIFYVLKDPGGNYYKLKFTAMVNENGVRGFPEFTYKLLE